MLSKGCVADGAPPNLPQNHSSRQPRLRATQPGQRHMLARSRYAPGVATQDSSEPTRRTTIQRATVTPI
eukprot:3484945-Amphidinium_carterae.1